MAEARGKPRDLCEGFTMGLSGSRLCARISSTNRPSTISMDAVRLATVQIHLENFFYLRLEKSSVRSNNAGL